MKKKLLLIVTALICALTCALSLVACNFGNTGSSSAPGTQGKPSEGSGDSKERYQVAKGSEWGEALSTIYEGFSATVTSIDVGEENELAWDTLCEYPREYKQYEIGGTKSDAAMITIRYDGNRLLCDWNDDLEAHYKDVSGSNVFDNAFERVWNIDEAQYDYYSYVKDEQNEWQSRKLEVGTTDKDALDKIGPAYVNYNSKTEVAVYDPNKWWYDNMSKPFSDLLIEAANRLRLPGDLHGEAVFDKETNSYKLDKGIVWNCGVLYADTSNYYNNHAVYITSGIFVQNFEIKFENNKCLSISYDACVLDKNIGMKAFSVEAVRNTDFVELPGGGHGKGLAYADRAEEIEDAAVVINGALKPTNFTKTISVTPDKNYKLTIGETHTFMVTETAMYIRSNVYTGDKKWNQDYDPYMWEETEIYESKESDAVYYYSKQSGESWKKQAEPAPDGVNALWKYIVDMRYNFLSVTDATKDKPNEEKPTAPRYKLIYDAENNVYWSADTGYCIRLGDNAAWSRMYSYNGDRRILVFVKWVIKDMGTTEVALPQVD